MAKETKDKNWSTLSRKKHIEQLINGLTRQLPGHYEKIVPAQTWTVYWITQSLSLLEQHQFLLQTTSEVIEFIRECAHPEGGYGGGPGQIAHLATTFAAVNTLITAASEEALDSLDRVSLVRFLHRMKQADGSFAMHDDGEVDSRATYCALAILRCLNIQDQILLENSSEWILSCQTYEGGFGSVPGSEAHGGYTFCCIASLCLMNQLHRADISSLLRWLTHKQLKDDGGFCGRSNKLVDSCYSYWQGAVFPLIHNHLQKTSQQNKHKDCGSNGASPEPSNRRTTRSSHTNKDRHKEDPSTESDGENDTKDSQFCLQGLNELLENWLFDCSALQDYVLNQCQAKSGLLRDKPGAIPDFYHTCYALSGLSISQHQPNDSLFDMGVQQANLLAPTHPLFNLTYENLNYCFDYFKNKSIQTFKGEK